MLELWLVRHAESEGNLRGDGSDTPLSERGIGQALALGPRLQSVAFDMVHSSDLLRCVETAVIALPGIDLRREPRLRERGDGPSPQPVNLSFLSSEQIDALVKNPVGQAPESTPEFRARLREWLFGLPNQGRVLAFAHQLVIQEIVRLWSAVGNPRDTIEISNASITRLERENGTSRLVCLNDIQHLQP